MDNKIKAIEHEKNVGYKVVNDRSVRAGAGIMFFIAFFAFSNAWFDQNFLYLKIAVLLFGLEFFVRVFLGLKYAIIANIADWIVRKQNPEFVGLTQKKFAWSLGLGMAIVMVFLLFIFEIKGFLNLTMCFICMMLMFFESSFGICIGCKIYYGLIHAGLIKKPEIKPACPGGACPIKK